MWIRIGLGLKNFSMLISASVVIYHKNVTLGGSMEHFTTNDGFKVMAYAKYSMSVTMQFGNFGSHAVTMRMLG